MDNETLEQQSQALLAGSPAPNAAPKPYITKTTVPLSSAATVSGSDDMPKPVVNPDAGSLVNTTKSASGVTKQHVNTGYPDSARLTQSGGDAYIGGSVSPNSTVRAAVRRPQAQFEADPFWLESTDRFAPVGPWTVDLAVLNKPATLKTTDVDKAAYELATNYQGISNDNFMGYEYASPENIRETWWSALLSGAAEGTADIIANGAWAIAGLIDSDVAATPKEVRDQINRESIVPFQAIAQRYLDKVTELEPLERNRAGDIAGLVGNFFPSQAPWLLTGMGFLGKAALSALLSATETLETRDKVMATGATPSEVRRAGWKHFGLVGATEVLGGAAGDFVNKAVVRTAISRGASRKAAQIAGAIGETVGASLTDAPLEVIQNKFSDIIAGQAGWDSIFNWSKDDWNTFYASLIVGATRIRSGAHEGGKAFDESAGALNGYLEMAAGLKKQLLEKADGPVSPAVLQAIDNMIMDIWNNPTGDFDSDAKNIVQGLFDRINNADPNSFVTKSARDFLNAGRAGELSADAMARFDERVDREMLSGIDLTDQQRQIVHGIARGFAYMAALFAGKNPADIKLPHITELSKSEAIVGDKAYYGKTGVGNGDVFIYLGKRERGYESSFDEKILKNKRGKYYTSITDVVNTLLHELSHSNDVKLKNDDIVNFGEFVKFYTAAIAEVFGEKHAKGVANVMAEGAPKTFGKAIKVVLNPNTSAEYTSYENTTEWRAQAIGRLGKAAKDYIGLTGAPAEFVQLANALFMGMDEASPLGGGVSEYIAALKQYVQENSNTIEKLRNTVPAERMRAAIQSYMGGNDSIDWYGVTPQTLEEFAKAIQNPLNADATQYALDALGDIDTEDFVKKAQADWDKAFEQPKDESEKTQKERLTDIDGGITFEDLGVEDWDSPTGEIGQYLTAPNDLNKNLVDGILADKREKVSEFRKKLNYKINGKTLEEDMDEFEALLKAHDFKKTGLFLDLMRGIHSYLSALGGQELDRKFDLVLRYENFNNKAQELNSKLLKTLLPLFNNSQWEYENYVRSSSVPMYEIKFVNPATKETETRMFSKRELLSAILYDEQPDSTDRIKKTVDLNEIRQYLTEQDIAFAHALRDFLYTEHTKIKKGQPGSEKVPENYWPIMSAYEYEKGNDKIINDFARMNTDDPVGLVDVFDVVGTYNSRVAGTQSGYFAAIRRLNSILNYNARAQITSAMSPEDWAKNNELDKKSTKIKQLVRQRLGAVYTERLDGRITDVIAHKNDNELRNGLVDKLARNTIGTLLYGNLKQFGINVGNLFSFLGYEHNTLASFMTGVVKALLNPAWAIRIANSNPTIQNRRIQYRYSEYMEKNLSANDDNLITYVANWASKKDWSSVEAVADFAIHVSQFVKKVLASPVIAGDFLGNVVGYAASYDAAVRALGDEKAAQESLSRFLSERQSTSNQAVKGLMVRRANRGGVFGNIFAFTGESTQKWGTIGQDINRMASGDLSVSQGIRDISGLTLSMLAYVAVQAGIIGGLLAMATGDGPDDEEWAKIYDNTFRELVGQLAGMAGPISNAVVQPTVQTLMFDRSFSSVSIPLLSTMAAEIEDLHKGNYDDAMYRALSLAGVANGLPRAMTSIEGAQKYLTGTPKEQIAGRWQMGGRGEGYANYMAGIKSKRASNKNRTRTSRKRVAN